jgi:hypothetical protein
MNYEERFFHREGAKKRQVKFNSISFFAFLRAFAVENLLSLAAGFPPPLPLNFPRQDGPAVHLNCPVIQAKTDIYGQSPRNRQTPQGSAEHPQDHQDHADDRHGQVSKGL